MIGALSQGVAKIAQRSHKQMQPCNISWVEVATKHDQPTGHGRQRPLEQSPEAHKDAELRRHYIRCYPGHTSSPVLENTAALASLAADDAITIARPRDAAV